MNLQTNVIFTCLYNGKLREFTVVEKHGNAIRVKIVGKDEYRCFSPNKMRNLRYSG